MSFLDLFTCFSAGLPDIEETAIKISQVHNKLNSLDDTNPSEENEPEKLITTPYDI